MANIVLLGAGSTAFSIELLKDISILPSLAGSRLSLVDIDVSRLHMAEELVTRYCKESNMQLSVQASTDRRDVLGGAEYVICAVKVGGYGPLEKERLQNSADITEGLGTEYLATMEESEPIIRFIFWKDWQRT